MRIAIQMGGVLRYKWEAYWQYSLSLEPRGTNRTAIRIGGVLRYKWEVHCDTFWEVVVVGVSDILLSLGESEFTVYLPNVSHFAAHLSLFWHVCMSPHHCLAFFCPGQSAEMCRGFGCVSEGFARDSPAGFLDERQITHLICARLKYDLYDFFRAVLGLLPALFLV